ncbi:plexin-A4 isoform X2 [Lingula anatina]|uniref:Plexin-A4 isoform X2 n=1 Tax=Lingula anatina TaxID=7574 RepID=A0A1S3K1A9_LINAN|nr:plexin-A4 isoform X2 [Lingula anatina]|eukprot:XP_013416174.1 plexin-A4 isoform X2 [Lingula anatina]
MPLRCEGTNSDYYYNLAKSISVTKLGSDNILVGTFVKGSATALCVFSMESINAVIKDRYEQCYAGNGNTEAAQFPRGPHRCQSLPSYNYGSYYCNHDYGSVNTPLVSTTPATSTPALTSTSSTWIAIATTTTTNYTVAFVGTADGQLKKILVQSNTSAVEYTSVQVSSDQVKDIKLDSVEEHLYVMTKYKVSKLKVEDCGSYSTCDECLASRDPYCGWCSLENKCSRKSWCSDADGTARWLPFDNGQCTKINTISPFNTPLARPTQVNLSVSLLPPGQTYQCVFDTTAVSATVTGGNLVTCDTPTSLPTIPTGDDHITIPLSIKSVTTGKKFLTTNFTYFDCGAHSGCVSCTSSSWACDWCIYANTCTHTSSTCSPSGGVIPGQNSHVNVGIKGPTQCPQLLPRAQDVLLPAGVTKVISLSGKNLPVPQAGQGDYQCKIGTNTVPAIRQNDSAIDCQSHAYVYRAITGQERHEIQVIWNNNHVIDQPMGSEVSAILYKCDIMGTTCGTCIGGVNTKFGCAFCGGTCKYRPTCSVPAENTCPDVIINWVSPLSAPIEGHTKVTINGTNLGTSDASIPTVRLAGVACRPVVEDYVVSKRIVCTAAEAPGRLPRNGSIEVQVQGLGRVYNYSKQFRYVDPKLETVFPVKGPMSGGTRLTVRGKDLNAGNLDNISLTLGEEMLPCIVDRSTIGSHSTICATPGVDRPKVVTSVRMFFDGSVRMLDQNPFRYTEDPVVEKIMPLASFLSGGRNLTITGKNFDSIQQPKMFVWYGKEKSTHNTTNCKHVPEMRDTVITCPSPRAPLGVIATAPPTVSSLRYKRQADENNSVKIGLIMDGVLSVQNLTNITNTMLYVVDPVFSNLTSDGSVYIQEGTNLVINGHFLNLAASKMDVTVLIGGVPCNVTSISTNQLVCTVPSSQPEGKDKNPPVVTVKMGNLNFQVGSLKYKQESEGALPPWVIGLIVGVVVVLLVIIIVIIIYNRRRAMKARQEYKKVQMQLDTLESNVRNECKQAFAELQTDMSDLTSDLIATGIPYWDFHSYAFKVLFPRQAYHQVLDRIDVDPGSRPSVEQGMRQFEQLLNNKAFLLVFIRTLEAQKGFGIKDKVNVASLLMIIFLNKMDYATEVLKSLLEDLVDKSVTGKHPKLMLRRTESVVEKLLTNWLSLSLYGYLKTSTGNPLFMLYKSIKHQMEKGPVDVVTADARYSLSEERLLREKIELKSITLNVVQEGGEMLQCRVLDCDSITQVKGKLLDAMYKNTPFSRRPPAETLDLEWRHGRGGHLVLQDQDVTSEYEDGWRRINTLAHYKVSDGAQMALVDSHNNTLRSTNSNMESTFMSVNSSTPMVQDVEQGAKAYHLTKPQDDGTIQKHGHKVISEIFLTRLLSTKGTLQKFIDDLFENILAVNGSLPPCIKYLFDFLDEQARRHGISDPEVVHTWKNNSLPLRFWVNIIKNPDFLFDIQVSHITDSCLSVIAQTFIDSCSTSEHRLGKDSPSNKLLFAKDIPRYKEKVQRFYNSIKDMPAVSDQEMAIAMNELSRTCCTQFNKTTAVWEVYHYATTYHDEIYEELQDSPEASKQRLPMKFEAVADTVRGEKDGYAEINFKSDDMRHVQFV